jgi:hypothetical protein
MKYHVYTRECFAVFRCIYCTKIALRRRFLRCVGHEKIVLPGVGWSGREWDIEEFVLKLISSSKYSIFQNNYKNKLNKFEANIRIQCTKTFNIKGCCTYFLLFLIFYVCSCK